MAGHRASPPYFLMRRSLAAPIAPAPLPTGVTLLPFGPVLAPACRDLLNRAYADGFGDVIPFERWWPRLESDSEYDPTLCFAAAADGKVAGFCQCWTTPFIKDIAVASRFRGQGLGAALITRALQSFAARAATHVDLKTDTENLKAQSLYRRLGFEIVERAG